MGSFKKLIEGLDVENVDGKKQVIELNVIEGGHWGYMTIPTTLNADQARQVAQALADTADEVSVRACGDMLSEELTASE